MQPTSPRRSSRARAVLPTTQTSHSSSNSSISSQRDRADRPTRSSLRHNSPSHKAGTPASVTSEESSDTMRPQSELPPRRSKRQHDHQEEAARAAEEAEDEGVEDEGTIRCICGSQDYPGPATDGLPEAQIDFVMCDSCKVWQHGGCVGIFDESTNPDNYFCEECKPDLHSLSRGYLNQRFSHYLPVWETQSAKSHRKSSIAKITDSRSKDKDRAARSAAAAAAAADHAKRRSTMNSRANYDEEEVLRKVLEESKHDAPGTTDSSSRRGKRIREDSEDNKRTLKRQRTRSSSPSSPMVDSDSQARDTPSGRQSQPRKLPLKVDHSKTYRDLAATSKELEKIEGAGKRKKAAAEKAVLSDSNSNPTPPEKIEPEPAEKTPQAEPAALIPPDTPSSAANPSTAVKKGTKQGTAKRGGRTIRNATRETETPTAVEHPSPSRKGRGAANKSKEGSGPEGAGSGGDSNITTNHHPIHNGFLGKRGRHASNHQQRDPSMLELRKKANAMAHYIRESEVELARWSEKGLSLAVAGLPVPDPLTTAMELDSSNAMSKEAMKLAGELSTRLVKWETEFGKFSERT